MSWSCTRGLVRRTTNPRQCAWMAVAALSSFGGGAFSSKRPRTFILALSLRPFQHRSPSPVNDLIACYCSMCRKIRSTGSQRTKSQFVQEREYLWSRNETPIDRQTLTTTGYILLHFRCFQVLNEPQTGSTVLARQFLDSPSSKFSQQGHRKGYSQFVRTVRNSTSSHGYSPRRSAALVTWFQLL